MATRAGLAKVAGASQEDLLAARMNMVLDYVGKMRDMEQAIPAVDADLTIKMAAMPVDVRDYFTKYTQCCQEISYKLSELVDAQTDLQRVSSQHSEGSDYRFCMQFLGLNVNEDDGDVRAAAKLVNDIKADLTALKRRRKELKPLIQCAEVDVFVAVRNRLATMRTDLETKKRRANIMVKLVYQ